jgi:hypothetical protein
MIDLLFTCLGVLFIVFLFIGTLAASLCFAAFMLRGKE